MSGGRRLSTPDGHTARAPAGVAWFVLIGVVVALLLADTLIRGGWLSALSIAPWPLLLLWVMWACFAAPRVHSDDRGLLVRNPLRSWQIPWGAVADLRMRWQVEVHLRDGRRIDAWALTARRQRRRAATDPAERELEILRSALDSAVDGERPGAEATVRPSWNLADLGVAAALVVWAVVAVVLTR